MSSENKIVEADIEEKISGFGKRLRKMRRDADLTLRELAPIFGVKYATIGKYEHVPHSYPSIPMLAKLATFFNTSIDYLLLGKEPAFATNNSVNGDLMNSTVIQASNSRTVVKANSPETKELLQIYKNLGVRDRLKLLNFAVKLDERNKTNG